MVVFKFPAGGYRRKVVSVLRKQRPSLNSDPTLLSKSGKCTVGKQASKGKKEKREREAEDDNSHGCLLGCLIAWPEERERDRGLEKENGRREKKRRDENKGKPFQKHMRTQRGAEKKLCCD